MKRLAAALTIAIASLTLGACGEREEPIDGSAAATQPLRLMLDYLPNADHVGIYEAQARGDFRRARIALDIRTPSDPSAPLKLLAAGRVDLAISYEPELLLARDRGTDLVAIAALVQRPLTSIIAIEGSPVRNVRDLRGRRVGTAGIPYQSAFLRTITQRNRLQPSDVEEVNVGFNLVPAMVSGRVDATLGAFWNYEGVQLRRSGRSPRIIPVDEAGIPTYNELVVVARADDLRDRGALMRRFLQALAAGHEAVRRDPERAARDLVAAVPSLRRQRAFQLAAIRATLPAFFPADEDLPFGYQDVGDWARFGAWMLSNELIRRPASPRSLTNEFLPGEGLRPTGAD